MTHRRRVPPPKRGLELFLLRPGDVLFNATNSPELVGKSAYFPGGDEATVFSNHFVRLRVNPDLLEGRYLARWLQTQFQNRTFENRCRRWVNQATFDRDSLLNMHIPLPPVKEQVRIAEILDKADALRALRRTALETLGSLGKSLFMSSFGKRLHTYHVHKLGDLASLVTKGTTPSSIGLQLAEVGVPFLRAQDLMQPIIDGSGVDTFVSSDVHAALRRSIIKPGDVLLSIAGTIGRCAVVSTEAPEMNCNQAVAIIRTTDGLSPTYLASWLRTPDALRQITGAKVTATISNLSLAQISNFRVPVPHHEEQIAFESIEQQARSISNAFGSAILADHDLFSSIQQRAFVGAL